MEQKEEPDELRVNITVCSTHTHFWIFNFFGFLMYRKPFIYLHLNGIDHGDGLNLHDNNVLLIEKIPMIPNV